MQPYLGLMGTPSHLWHVFIAARRDGFAMWLLFHEESGKIKGCIILGSDAVSWVTSQRSLKLTGQ